MNNHSKKYLFGFQNIILKQLHNLIIIIQTINVNRYYSKFILF